MFISINTQYSQYLSIFISINTYNNYLICFINTHKVFVFHV